MLLEGGVLGRADDMMIIRGVNIYPSAIEQILHSFPEVVEYRLTARKRGELDELVIEVEDHLEQPARIAEELRIRLGLKVEVRAVPAMSLPRFEGKGRRFVDERIAELHNFLTGYRIDGIREPCVSKYSSCQSCRSCQNL